MKTTIALAMLIISGSAGAFDLKGISPGNTLADAELLYPRISENCRSQPSPDGSTICMYLGPAASDRRRPPQYIPLDTFAGQPVRYFAFSHRERTIGSVSISLDNRHFEAVKLALIEKFGKPVSTEPGEVTNGMGVKFDQETVYWRDGDQRLFVRKRSANVNLMGISLLSAAEKERSEDATKAGAKVNAKDL